MPDIVSLEKELKEDFLSCSLTRERLVDMLEEDVDKSLKRMRNAASGGVQNLAEYYADELARQKSLEDVITLIKEI